MQLVRLGVGHLTFEPFPSESTVAAHGGGGDVRSRSDG